MRRLGLTLSPHAPMLQNLSLTQQSKHFAHNARFFWDIGNVGFWGVKGLDGESREATTPTYELWSKGKVKTARNASLTKCSGTFVQDSWVKLAKHDFASLVLTQVLQAELLPIGDRPR